MTWVPSNSFTCQCLHWTPECHSTSLPASACIGLGCHRTALPTKACIGLFCLPEPYIRLGCQTTALPASVCTGLRVPHNIFTCQCLCSTWGPQCSTQVGPGHRNIPRHKLVCKTTTVHAKREGKVFFTTTSVCIMQCHCINISQTIFPECCTVSA